MAAAPAPNPFDPSPALAAALATPDPMERAVQAFKQFRVGWQGFLSAKSVYSDTETAALTAYKGFGFQSINTALRQQATLAAEGAGVVNTLDELTHTSTVQKEFSVYRGFKSFRNLSVGEEFADAGFVSTSANPFVAETFAQGREDILAEIRVGKGARGFYMASHPVWGQGDREAEFLLPRGTRFKVLEELPKESAHGPRRLVLEAITPGNRPSPVPNAKPPVLSTAGKGAQIAQNTKTAAAVAAKQTLSETHVNLESKVGGFLKKAMGLPFLKKSRVDTIAATVQAARGITQTVGENTKRQFKMVSTRGLSTLSTSRDDVGDLFRVNKGTAAPVAARNNPVARGSVDLGARGSIEETATEVVRQKAPALEVGGSTHITITDAPLDHVRLDKAFARFYETGFPT